MLHEHRRASLHGLEPGVHDRRDRLVEAARALAFADPLAAARALWISLEATRHDIECAAEADAAGLGGARVDWLDGAARRAAVLVVGARALWSSRLIAAPRWRPAADAGVARSVFEAAAAVATEIDAADAAWARGEAAGGDHLTAALDRLDELDSALRAFAATVRGGDHA